MNDLDSVNSQRTNLKWASCQDKHQKGRNRTKSSGQKYNSITKVKNQDYKLRVKLLWLEQLGTSTIKRWENHQKEGEK